MCSGMRKYYIAMRGYEQFEEYKQIAVLWRPTS